MCFTKVFYYIYFILFSLHNEFTYTKCSLLSRVKNPVEHVLTTTPESLYELPRNIYRYEPYKGHRTLWRPTSTNKQASLKQRQSASRTRAKIMKQQYRPLVGDHKGSSTIQSYWHHFDDDEQAWPKVILLLSSTERTTTRRKQNKKTFASYFPHLSHRYTTTENTNSEDESDSDEGDNVTETFKPKDFGTNSISLNSDRFNDNVIHLRAEDDTEKEEAKYIEVTKLINVNTTTTKNSLDIGTKINEIKAEAELKKEMGLKTREELKKEEKVTIAEKLNKGKKISKKVKIKNWEQKPIKELKRKGETDIKGNNSDAGPHCYQCGLNVPEIPSQPTCHQIFAGDERKYFFIKPKYKVKCQKSFKGGCFRRFLDIGATYDERGCRTMPPLLGESFASKRMAILEKTIHSLREGCITSPHASLTPFSRAISLFARYHVCICVGKYCNQGNVLHADSFTFIICFFSTMFALSSCLTEWT